MNRYTRESNEGLARRFGYGPELLPHPDDITEIQHLVQNKLEEAKEKKLVAPIGDGNRAKAVIFSALEDPEIDGWLEFVQSAGNRTCRVTREYETPCLMDTYGGGLAAFSSITYEIVGPNEPSDSGLTVVGFKLSLEDTNEDRELAAKAVEDGKDPLGIGKEALAFYADGEEQGLRRLSLNALQGVLLGVKNNEPIIEITDLQKAIILLEGLSLITGPRVALLKSDILFGELVRPDVEHRITELSI